MRACATSCLVCFLELHALCYRGGGGESEDENDVERVGDQFPVTLG